MNSNNGRYNLAKYFLCADLVLLVAGIVIMCLFGFNVSSTQGEHLILQSVLSVIISLALIFLYVGFRYDWAKAFSLVLVSAHNVLLATALVCLIRIPVSEAITMGYVLLVGLTSVFGLILFDKVKADEKKLDKDLAIKNSLSGSLRLIAIFSATVVALLLLCLIFASDSIFDFARECFAMMLVLIYSIFTIALPVYLFFARRIRKKSRAKVDSSVENQKVYQATPTEEKSLTENE